MFGREYGLFAAAREVYFGH